ncbi:SERTA domain-containing protein 3 [Ornithorhynchus anatinus]|uniref:SERTA domain-containing protein 3 n=1 Tax=Ornithorhynchus anatinus TaxID=9258 RepID=UPI0010A7FC39|nr:SERTA domain-containing protein 3 [Ornithorhynchus anatinus]
MLTGVKRKRADCEDAGVAAGGEGPAPPGLEAYSRLRQSLLHMSLDKFQRGCMLGEPNLRRHVLIANTLHQIQEEIRRERGPPPSASVPPPPPPSPEPPPPPPAELDGLLFSGEDDFSVSSAICSILKELELALDGGATPLESQAKPEPRGGPRAGPGSPGTPGLSERETPAPADFRAVEAVFGSFEIMSSSYLSGLALDDLFTDIDTSGFERDPGGRPPLPLAPAEPGSLTPSCTPSQPVGRDWNELDHIMEIIVGS